MDGQIPKNRKDHSGLSNALIKYSFDCFFIPLAALDKSIWPYRPLTFLQVIKVVPVLKKGRHDHNLQSIEGLLECPRSVKCH